MPYATWIPSALRRMGVEVEEANGWQRRGSSQFEPRGVVCHHTAAVSRSDRPSLRICLEGRGDLPGPLCNVLLTRSGAAVVVAAGRANHAGLGSFRGLAGNRSVLGIEAENDGRDEPWSDRQLVAYRRVVAGLLSGIERDETWCIAHREWAPRRKIDPTFDMDAFRHEVGTILRNGAGGAGETGPVEPTGAVLRLDSRGPAVREWQAALNRTGARLAEDGEFGPATERATRDFQAAARLTVDGIVGPQTRAAMQERLASLVAETSRAVLRRGDRGAAVADWQNLLNRAGATIAVDGDFGPATDRATREFQSTAGLVVDGVVGPKTRAAMDQRLLHPS